MKNFTRIFIFVSIIIVTSSLNNLTVAKEILKPIDSIDVNKELFFKGLASDGVDLWFIRGRSDWGYDSIFKVNLNKKKVEWGFKVPGPVKNWFMGLVYDSTSDFGPFLWTNDFLDYRPLYKIKIEHFNDYFNSYVVDSFFLPCKWTAGMALHSDTLWIVCASTERLYAFDLKSKNYEIISILHINADNLAISVGSNSQINFWIMGYPLEINSSFLQLINPYHSGEILSVFEIENLRCTGLTIDDFSPGGPFFWINCGNELYKWKIYKFKIPDVTSINDNNSEFRENIITNPNPFTESTTINFNIVSNCEVRLSVYNFLGQEVAVLVNQFLPAGQHAEKFDGTNLPQGTYFYKLQAGAEVKTGKIMLINN
jgi:hypothetical protein